MESIQELASACRVAGHSDKVVHSECVFTFHSPYTSDQGILVNLETFVGTIQSLALKSESKEKAVFLRVVKKRVERPAEETEGGQEKKPTKLAIGVQGGFSTEDDKYQTETAYSVVVLQKPHRVVAELPYNQDTKHTFPDQVVKSVDSIINHAGLAVQQDLTAWQDDQEIPVSKYHKNLEFVDNGVTISPDPKSWKCQKSGDTENLWLNLSDGYIGGGRKNWDGSGGSNGALDHYLDTGEKYPLVVKLGTISADSTGVNADCYSYAKDEDGPVKIPNLAELLSKRGIQVATLQKTAKSTAELEVELNANYAFDAITESGSKLTPLSGPSYQGLQNLGNSCYLNSVVQLLCTLPEFAGRYGTSPNGSLTDSRFQEGCTPRGAVSNILVQTTKLACALTSGAFSIPSDQLESDAPTDPKYRLAPRMFKHLIGENHVDFRTGQQQDAAHFLQYLLEQIDRAEMKCDKNMTPTSNMFEYKTETRIVCNKDGKVKYKDGAPETIWSLRLPMDKAKIASETDIEPEQKKQKQEADDDDEDKPVPKLSLEDCIQTWAADSTLDDLRWPHLGNQVFPSSQRLRFKTFPDYLWVQAQRYKLGPDWQPVKIEVELEIPDLVDLNMYRGKGLQEGEEAAPDEEVTPEPSTQPGISEAALSQLMDMGFSMNGCKRALTAVGGADVESAMTWIFEHNTDPDFNDPLPEPSGDAATASASNDADDAVVMSLVESLGCFTIDQVRAALKQTNGAADRAADWLFSHMDDLDTAVASVSAPADSSAKPAGKELRDGDGKYRLLGMISHIGKSTASGHYVAHIKKDGKWIIFNDEKVAVSEKPPIAHAYLYLFERVKEN